tara:strand:+ start:166 stop:639 length:474 start_codon:yes stop_codon:yes gene_type:complete
VKLEVLVISGVFIGLLVSLIKQLTAFSVRPGFFRFDEINYLEPIFLYSSFPSGHSASIVGLILIWLNESIVNIKKIESKFIIFIFMVLAISVSISRVMVGAHWLSDILGSFGIAIMASEVIKISNVKTFLVSQFSRNISYLLVVLSWTYMITQGSIY